MNMQSKANVDEIEKSGGAPDLVAKYGPIGLKAVLSACLLQRREKDLAVSTFRPAIHD